jgi:hypothetical protein
MESSARVTVRCPPVAKRPDVMPATTWRIGGEDVMRNPLVVFAIATIVIGTTAFRGQVARGRPLRALASTMAPLFAILRWG